MPADASRSRTMGASELDALVAQISGVELLADLEGPELRQLAGYLLGRDYEPGATIFREGEPGSFLGLLVEGEVRIFKETDARQTRTVAVENRSRAVGEMALIDGEPRSASCIAVKRTRLLVLTRDQFDRLGHERPVLALKLALRIARLISRRLRMTSGRLVDHLDS